jgi:gamma-glutamyl-gamma-aminobutyrate hydrolase PuuD
MSENKSSNAGQTGHEPPAAGSSGVPEGPGAIAQTSSVRPPDLPAETAPGRDASAAERASTDAPASASTVEPVDPAAAQRADAAQTRAAPSREPPGGKSSLAAEIESATEAQAAEAETVAQSTPSRPAVSLPADFTAAPDFGASRPPPIPPNASNEQPAQPAYLKQSDSAWSVMGRVIAARARQIFDRAGHRITQRTLRIGVSARIFHPEPGAKGLRGKTLQYLEESIAHWVMSRDVLVFMIPTVGHQGMLHPSNIRLRDYAKHLDGLLLQGGADVSPQSYTEAATRHEWPGDRVRDMYELELLHEFIESGKPVLGVCRGCQLINVAFGGTLYQDIATDVPTAGIHVNEQYDQHRHPIRFPDGSTLVNMFPGRRDAVVNSIHHQAVRTLGRDLNIEAVSASDGIIEAVRYRRAPFVMGVQWHPEFHRAGGDELLDCTPLLDTFLRVARETRF